MAQAAGEVREGVGAGEELRMERVTRSTTYG
jgi:hypothetical protein